MPEGNDKLERGRFEGQVLAKLDNLTNYVGNIDTAMKDNRSRINEMSEDVAGLKVKTEELDDDIKSARNKSMVVGGGSGGLALIIGQLKDMLATGG